VGGLPYRALPPYPRHLFPTRMQGTWCGPATSGMRSPELGEGPAGIAAFRVPVPPHPHWAAERWERQREPARGTLAGLPEDFASLSHGHFGVCNPRLSCLLRAVPLQIGDARPIPRSYRRIPGTETATVTRWAAIAVATRGGRANLVTPVSSIRSMKIVSPSSSCPGTAHDGQDVCGAAALQSAVTLRFHLFSIVAARLTLVAALWSIFRACSSLCAPRRSSMVSCTGSSFAAIVYSAA